jgi:hypothetical protein
VKNIFALTTLLIGTVFAGSALADPVPVSTEAKPEINFGENLFKAFSNICLANRGSLAASSKAAEESVFKFTKTEVKRTKEFEFMKFPLQVVLKRWNKKNYTCLAQSVTENSVTLEALVDRIKQSDSSLSELTFTPVKDGMNGMFPQPAKAKKKRNPDVIVRITPSFLKDGLTVQLAIDATELETPATTR